jgi:small subunit ribosomal protein S7
MRGKRAVKRVIKPDSKYGNEVVARFVNYLMFDGKKQVAQRVLYSAFDVIKEKSGKDPLEVFEAALKNVMPSVEVKSKRVGGANYQIPMQVRGDRRYALAFRWIIGVARGRKGRPMSEKLAAEFLAAAEGEGDAVKKRMDVHRMAEANRAFAHFAR